MKQAIFAHFDPDDKWQDNFLEILSIINNFFEKTIVVTTSQNISNLPPEFDDIKLIKRPNIGYDFYSFRVGYNICKEEENCKGILFINSSFYLINKEKFRNTLNLMIKRSRRNKVIGLTASKQFFFHLQSYLIYIQLNKRSKKILEEIILKVEPQNTKFEVIMNYEIGFSQKLIKSNFKIEPLLSRHSFSNIIYIYSTFARTQLNIFGYSINNVNSILLNLKNINWSLIGSDLISKKFGIVKAEIIKKNINQINLDKYVWQYCDPKLENSIKRETNCYKHIDKSKENRDFLKKIPGSIPFHNERTTAVVLHLYYIELIEELFNYLSNIIVQFNLYITTPFESFVPKILELSKIRKIPVTIFICKNIGRDIYPFLKLYRSGLLDNYKSILKIHSKKSSYSNRGDYWRKSLLYSLCGTSLIALKSIKMLENNEIGIVGTYKYFLSNPSYNGSNVKLVNKIYKSLDIEPITDKSKTSFFAGSMFWFNPKALSLLKSDEICKIQFEAEEGKQDGTLAHAYERVFIALCEKNSFLYADIKKGIFKKSDEEILFNTVPVL